MYPDYWICFKAVLHGTDINEAKIEDWEEDNKIDEETHWKEVKYLCKIWAFFIDFLRSWNYFPPGIESMVILKAEVSFIEVNFSLNCFTTCSILRTHSVLTGSQNNYYAKMAQVGIIYSGHLQWAYTWNWHITILQQPMVNPVVIWPHLIKKWPGDVVQIMFKKGALNLAVHALYFRLR